MSNEEILQELGFGRADQAMKDRVIENVRTLVELRVIGIVSELMTDDQEAEFETLQAQGDSNAVWEWLRTQVAGVDIHDVYEAALRDYIDERKVNAAEVPQEG